MEQISDPYIRIGSITPSVARQAAEQTRTRLQPAPIYVSRNQLRHIGSKHKNELDSLGFSPLAYVKSICQQFNQIRKGTGNSILLVIEAPELNHTAAVDLNFTLNAQRGFWEIKTAEPRRNSAIKNKALIWEAAKHTPGGHGHRPN